MFKKSTLTPQNLDKIDTMKGSKVKSTLRWSKARKVMFNQGNTKLTKSLSKRIGKVQIQQVLLTEHQAKSKTSPISKQEIKVRIQ